MPSRTPAEFSKEVHRQFLVLRCGRSAVAEYAKALDRSRVVLVGEAATVTEPLQASSPAEFSTRFVAAIFGHGSSRRAPVVLPTPEVSLASWEDWRAASGGAA